MEPVIGLLIHLLVLVLVMVIVIWVAQLVIGALGGPPVAIVIVKAICALILVLWLLNVVLGSGVPRLSWPR